MKTKAEDILKAVGILIERLEEWALPDFNLYEEYFEPEDNKLVSWANAQLNKLKLIRNKIDSAPEIAWDEMGFILSTLVNAVNAEKDLNTRLKYLMDKKSFEEFKKQV